MTLVSGSTVDLGADSLPTRRRRDAIHGTRDVSLADMTRTRPAADVQVVPVGAVRLEGEAVWCEPADSVPLSRLYFL
jgi:urease subunit alpha